VFDTIEAGMGRAIAFMLPSQPENSESGKI